MFGLQESNPVPRFTFTAKAMLVLLVLALVANLGSGGLLLAEYSELSDKLDRALPLTPTESESLTAEVRFELVFTLVVSITLVCCAVGLSFLQGHYRADRRSMQDVRQLAHDILASMDSGVLTVDPAGRITGINSAALRILGVDQSFIARPDSDLPGVGSEIAALRQAVDRGGAPVLDHELQLPRDGHIRRLRADAYVLKSSQGERAGTVVHLRDVTERSLLEERMRRMEGFLHLGTLASGLHHEIKNPLTALSIHVQLLEEALEKTGGDASAGELIDVLKTEVQRLNGVLESFRDFAAVSSLNIAPTEVCELLQDLLRLIRPQAERQNVSVELSLPAGRLPPVAMDAERFKQAVLNLVINALEAMPGGGRLKLAAARAGDRFEVAVIDTGPGIAPSVKANMFQPYFSTKSRGTGMGLALTEKWISLHRGQVECATGPQGTAFRLSLPMSAPPQTRETQA